eukprot:12500406-Ditylum_brightwellii.AAC.1
MGLVIPPSGRLSSILFVCTEPSSENVSSDHRDSCFDDADVVLVLLLLEEMCVLHWQEEEAHPRFIVFHDQ